jgi:hypothetical protein
MTVFSITTQKKVVAFIDWLKKRLAEGKSVVLHLDECDHGTGSKQMLSKVWSEVRNSEKITNILYSATPEEVLYSGEVEDQEYQEMMEEMIGEGEHIEYTPPEGYCGPARFLHEGLVHEAIPFFDSIGDTYTLTSQGKHIVTTLRTCMASTPGRNLVVLRLSYSLLGGAKKDIKKNKAIYQFLSNLSAFPELADFLIVVDKSDNVWVLQLLKKCNLSDGSAWDSLILTLKSDLLQGVDLSSLYVLGLVHDTVSALTDHFELLVLINLRLHFSLLSQLYYISL